MVKKAKMKVSKLKHSNQVITKLKKQGKIKTQRHRKRKIINRAPKSGGQHQQQDYSDDESLQGSDMMDMMEDEEMDYLMKTHKAKSNGLDKQTTSKGGKSGKKRKAEENDEEHLEMDYENIDRPVVTQKKMKQLLPIKTKLGFQTRQLDPAERKMNHISQEFSEDEEMEELTEKTESDEEIVTKTEAPIVDASKPLSTAQIFVARHEELQNKKFKIGVLCSGILESPENKSDNFFGLLNFLDDKNKSGNENLLTVRKLAAISLLEVFKDILPDYQITQQDFGETKLKKDTLMLHKFETSLLAHYKRYLQRLEKMASVLVKKKGDARKVDAGRIKLAHIAITCLCDLLVSHSYFNYSSNIGHLLVPFLNNRDISIRLIVSECFKTIFKADKKGVISLMLVRKINQLVKGKSNDVQCEVLNCLLSLRIMEINLDDEKKLEMKQKKQTSHKQRLISMSKKERKRNKKLQELEKEMLETKAEENKQTKQQNLTEIVKVVFTIYFRILKRSPNSRLLGATLEGLSKFAHVMNLEYFSDLVNLLDKLLEDEDLGYREQLHCVETVFTILSGQGDVLNIDPSRFYSHLYRNLLKINAGKSHADLMIILKAVTSVLIKRRKKVSQQILLAFTKRVCTLSTQVLHNGTLGCLGIVRNVLQQTKQSEVLLELDSDLGSGRYDAMLMEPEYCNAAGTSLYELSLLRRHFHPTVKQLAAHIMNHVPSSGEGSLPTDVAKLSGEQLFERYDGGQMSFKPSIPVPKKASPAARPKPHSFTHPTFQEYCQYAAGVTAPRASFNFYKKFVYRGKVV